MCKKSFSLPILIFTALCSIGSYALPLNNIIEKGFQPYEQYSYESEADNGDVIYPCGDITSGTLPWYYTFENPQNLDCWTIIQGINMSLFGQIISYPQITGGNGYNSANSLIFTLGKSMIATPKISSQPAGLTLTFFAQGDTAAHLMELGIVSDLTDTNTYQFLSYIAVDSSYTENTFVFDDMDVSLTDKYIVLRYNGSVNMDGSNFTQVHIDDFMLYIQSDCQSPVLNSVSFSNITSDEATVSFIDTNEYHDSWIVYYKKAGSNDEYDAIPTDEQSAVITDLEPQTTYYVYVKTDCGNEQSGSTIVKQFKTACAPLTEEDLPLTESFENGNPLCWTTVQGVEIYGGEYYPAPNSYGGGHSGSYSMAFSDDICIWASPKLDVDIESLRLSFWHLNMFGDQTGTMEIGVASSLDDSMTTYQSIYTVTQDGFDWYYNSVTFENSPVTGSGNYIVFKFIPAEDGFSISNFYVDDILLEMLPGCVAPASASIQVQNITATSAEITFNDDNEQHDAWIVYYKSSTDEQWQNDVTNEHNITLTNLNPSSSYEFYIRTDCGNDELKYDSTMMQYFYTKSSTLVDNFPFEENFEEGISEVWEYTNINENRWVAGTATGKGTDNGVHSLYISNNNGLTNEYTTTKLTYSMAALRVNFSDAPQYNLSFDYKVAGEGTQDNPFDYFTVYIADDSVDISNIFYLQSLNQIVPPITNQTTWNNFSLPLNDVQNSSKKIIFLWFNNNYGGSQPAAAIDNVIISESSCIAPYNITVDVTDSSATLQWSGTQEQTYQIKLGENGSINDTEDTVYTFNGLTKNNFYTAYLRSDCSDEQSSWQTVFFKAKTPCQTIITDLDVSICEGEEYYYQGWSFTEPDTYYFQFDTEDGCDSIVKLTLSVNIPSSDTIEKSICSDQTYEFNGEILNKSGVYKQTTHLESGCDSVTVLILMVYPAYKNVSYTEDNPEGLYKDGDTVSNEQLQTINGCDSVITVIYRQSAIDMTGNNISVSLFPNPAKEKTILHTEGMQGNIELIMTDNNGKTVLKQVMGKENKDVELPLQNLTSGIYLIRIFSDGKLINTQKLIKQ